MRKPIILSLILVFIGLLSLNAQEMSFGLEQRNRGEIGRGYKGIFGDNSGAGGLIWNRSRVIVGLASQYVDAKVTLQYNGMWGRSDKSSSNNNVVLYESYANIKFGHGLAFKAGRQEMKYDEGRIISSPQWGNNGTSHDAMILSYTNSNLKVHLGGAYNNDAKNQEFFKTDTYSLASDKWYRSMFFGWGRYQFAHNVGLSAMYLNEGLLDEQGKTRYRSTYGGQLDYKDDALAVTLSGYAQAGHNYKNEKEGGFFLAGWASYKFLPQFGIKLGYDYYSNDRDGHKGFSWLYGSPHNFGGYMDLWLENLHTINGLHDAYLGVFGKGKHLGYSLDWHNFRMVKEFSSAEGKSLGNEIDFTLSYPFKEWITVDLGTSLYVLTDACRTVKKTSLDATSFGYVTLTVKPSALKLALKKQK